MSAHPVATVLVHPDDNPADPAACRIVRIATTHDGEWPWRRLTGDVVKLPPRESALDGWTVQPLWELAVVMGHGKGGS